MADISVFFVLASLAALFCFWIHTFIGQREILGAVAGAQLPAAVRGTVAACWHLTTALLALQTLCLGYLSFQSQAGGIPDPTETVLAWQVVGLNLLLSAFFVLESLILFRNIFGLPQPLLLAPISGLTAAALLWPVQVPTAALGGLIAALVLLTIAAVHIAWARGSHWPAADPGALNELVVGQPRGARFPSQPLTALVALALAVAAIIIAVLGIIVTPTSWLTWLGYPVLGIFLVRGLGGFCENWLRPITRQLPYGYWNRVLYSPLCLLIAACGFVAIRW